MYEPGPSNFSRSNEDLFSSPFDSMRHSTQTPYSSLIPPEFRSGFRDSDFVEPGKYSSPLRRSFDALNDFADMHQSFPTTRPYPPEQQQQQQQQPYYRSTYQTQHQPQPQSQQQQQQQQQPSYVNQAYINPNIVYTNEFGAPMDHYQPNTFQGTGAGICKYNLISSLFLFGHVMFYFVIRKKYISFLYLPTEGVVDSLRKYVFVISLPSQTKYKEHLEFAFKPVDIFDYESGFTFLRKNSNIVTLRA